MVCACGKIGDEMENILRRDLYRGSKRHQHEILLSESAGIMLCIRWVSVTASRTGMQNRLPSVIQPWTPEPASSSNDFAWVSAQGEIDVFDDTSHHPDGACIPHVQLSRDVKPDDSSLPLSQACVAVVVEAINALLIWPSDVEALCVT